MDPYINKTPINKEEEKLIFELHKKLGNKWADIAKDLPGRSDNCIKNYFYFTHRKHQRPINKCLRNAQVGKSLLSPFSPEPASQALLTSLFHRTSRHFFSLTSIVTYTKAGELLELLNSCST